MADPNNSFTNDRSESDNDSSQEENRDAVTSPNSHGTLLGFLENLSFKYVPFPCDNSQPTFDNRPQRRWYDGPEGLRRGVSNSFDNPFQCLSRCGGLDYVLVARLAAGSNDYFHAVIKPTLRKNNVWHHLVWNDITTAEIASFRWIEIGPDRAITMLFHEKQAGYGDNSCQYGHMPHHLSRMTAKETLFGRS